MKIKNWLLISTLNLRNKRITFFEFCKQFWSIFRHRQFYFEDSVKKLSNNKLNIQKTLYIIRGPRLHLVCFQISIWF